jgi:hypothetical protein
MEKLLEMLEVLQKYRRPMGNTKPEPLVKVRFLGIPMEG